MSENIGWYEKIKDWLRMRTQTATPATPPANDWRLYFRADGLYTLDSSGTETGPLGTGTVVKTLIFYVAGTLSVASSPMRIHAPEAMTVTNITAAVGTAPTGASLIVDVNLGGTTIFTTQGNRPTITSGNTEDLSSTPDVTSIAQNDVLTVDIDQVGSTVAGADLVVQVRCTV